VQVDKPSQFVTTESVAELWVRLVKLLSEKSPILANHLQLAQSPAIFGPNSLAFRFDPRYTHAYEICATDANVLRLKDCLQQLTGQVYLVRIELLGPTATSEANPTPLATQQPGERRKQLMNLPIFRKASEVLGAQIWHMDDEFSPNTTPRQRTENTPLQHPEEY
jgi:hypothetical protein